MEQAFNKLNLQEKECLVVCMHMHSSRSRFVFVFSLAQISNPGIRRCRIVACFVIEFTVGPSSRVEVDVVPGGLKSQMHIVLACRRTVMYLVLKEGLVIVSC